MKNLRLLAIAVAGSLLFTACTKSTDKNDTSGNHQIEVRLTDGPYDAEEVNVDIQKVQLHFTDDPNGGWYDLTTFAGVHNLLALQNGIDIALATGTFPQTNVTELRLILGDNNSIKIAGVLTPIKVPSGSESGLKIKINKTLVQPVTTFLVDFDAGLSIHRTGNGTFMLQPVVRLK